MVQITKRNYFPFTAEIITQMLLKTNLLEFIKIILGEKVLLN